MNSLHCHSNGERKISKSKQITNTMSDGDMFCKEQ